MIIRGIFGFALTMVAIPIQAEPPSGGQPALYSGCILAEIARLEGVTTDKLNSFSKKNARKAFKTCQPAKKMWAQSLDQKFATQAAFSNATVRQAEVNRIISEDELAVLLLVNLQAK